MHRTVEDKITELAVICRQRGVRRLALFGSAARDQFDASTSDLDFLVEFDAMPPVRHAISYFGLIEDLERLFGRPVDLIEPDTIRNPYFRQAVEETQVAVYDLA